MPIAVSNEPLYSNAIRSLLTELGHHLSAGKTVVEAFEVAIRGMSNSPLRQACQDILQRTEAGSSGDAVPHQQMLAWHRDVFPIPVIAAIEELSGEMQRLSGDLEPISGERLRTALGRMEQSWPYTPQLGEFPKIRGYNA